MKIILLGFCFLLACASVIPTPEPRIYTVADVKKDVIYEKTIQWIAENFKSASDVIQYKNQGEGKIICQGVTSVDVPMDVYQRAISFTWIIEIKDNKMRVEYKNIQSVSVGQVVGIDYNTYTSDSIDKQMGAMVVNLIQYIKGSEKKSDW